MVHQLRPGEGIMFTTRRESFKDKTQHLKLIRHNGQLQLILVLEDFYDDLKNAAEKLIILFETKKLTNKKGEKAFLDVITPNKK